MTGQELATLPNHAVVIDRDEDVWQLRGGVWCSYETAPQPHERMHKFEPYRLLMPRA